MVTSFACTFESAFDSLGFYADVDDFFDFSVQYFCAVFVDVDLLESRRLFFWLVALPFVYPPRRPLILVGEFY
jgi:hypothetical protein